MRGRIGSKVLLIAGAAVLTVLLYLAPKKSMKQPGKPELQNTDFNISDLLLFQEKNLDELEKARVQNWKNMLNEQQEENLGIYDSLASLWDKKSMYALSGHYYNQKAALDQEEESYLQAAYRFFDAYKQAVDSSMRVAMVSAAIESYSRVLELNPENENAKTDLGILYAEGTAQPMKGIKLLQEVVAGNPEHENAQLNLGILSVRSQQFDKAVSRFQKVLAINPQRQDARLLLAQTYMQTGENNLAAEQLEIYKAAATDPEVIEKVDRMLEKLK